MGGLLKLVSGPAGDIITQIGNVIDKFVTTGQEKLAAQQELVKIERDFQLKMAELDQTWAATQADVIKTEAQSTSWLTRNWRPITVLWLVFLLSYTVWTGGYVNGHQLSEALQLKLLEIIQYALSGYIVGRTAEKIAPAVTEIFAKKK